MRRSKKRHDECERSFDVRRAAGSERRSGPSRAGLTLVEVLVALAVIALLLAVVVPAVQSTRHTARRVECASNLKQIGIATHVYTDAYQVVPSLDAGGFLLGIMPHLDMKERHEATSAALASGNHAAVPDAVGVARIYQCPEDGELPPQPGASNYVLNRGSYPQEGANLAFLKFNGSIRWVDVTDGLSQTALASETVGTKFDPLSPDPYRGERGFGVWFTWTPGPCGRSMEWMGERCLRDIDSRPADRGLSRMATHALNDGYNHTLPPNSGTCQSGPNPCLVDARTAASRHAGGVQVLVADGAVRFVSQSVDASVWRSAGSIAGGDGGTTW